MTGEERQSYTREEAGLEAATGSMAEAAAGMEATVRAPMFTQAAEGIPPHEQAAAGMRNHTQAAAARAATAITISPGISGRASV
jgi:hypothetical protein